MQRASHLLPVLVLVVGFAACSRSQPPPSARPAGAASPASASDVRVVAGGLATSFDEVRQVPRFLWAAGRPAAPAGATPAVAARAHLARLAAAYRLRDADLDTVEPVFVHDTGRGGIIVALRQRSHGVEIYRSEVKVLMGRDLALEAVSGSPLAPPAAAPPFGLTPAAGLASALAAHLGVAVAPADLADLGPSPGGYERFTLRQPLAVGSTRVLLTDPARVKPVLFPAGAALVPAYFVEVITGAETRRSSDAVRYLVAADDGRVLERQSLVDSFGYRVFAEAGGRPLDGPVADFTPHPTGQPDGSYPAFVAPTLVTTDGFNHNPYGNSDPWLPSTAQQTLGNNVDAYADLIPPDGYSNGDLRATTTATGTFDRTYDLLANPLASQSQTMASTTHLFYVTNWLHDWYYDSGFDEAAGNAQQNNFDRGGLGGDRLLAEAQDSPYDGMRDNANMTTPADGASPRMQVYLWSGKDEIVRLTVTPPGTDLETGTAFFGPQDFDVTGQVVLAVDQTAPTSDGCEAIQNNVAGKIALIDRGTCAFVNKVANAQTAGAIGVIIANNAAGAPPALGGKPTTTLTIPTLSVSLDDGTAMKTNLQAGAVTATMYRNSGTRDGSLDSTMIAHEWGHYMFRRLGGSSGMLMAAALSEGFADFTALHMVLREGDNLAGTFGLSIYATIALGDVGYFGIRRAPYSTDPAKNAFRFRHISDGEALPTHPLNLIYDPNNFESHNSGEVWAAIMFEAYAALLGEAGPSPAPSFDEVRRLMSDYVVAGLMLLPPDATFTEARDALLAAAASRSTADMDTLAAAFARRGLGSCAVSPPRDSKTLVGVIESYEVKPRLAVGAVQLDDQPGSCDNDGVLDAQETGTLSIEIANAGAAVLSGATVSVSSTTAGVLFPAGATVDLADIPPFGTTVATLQVGLDGSVTGIQALDLSVSVAAGDACAATAEASASFRVNYDEAPASSATDDVECTATPWTPGGADGDAIWTRAQESGSVNHVWHGADLGRVSDGWLTSPPLTVGTGANLLMTFRHRYQFESDTLGDYDGGLIEYSVDGGATWEDISVLADPGYGGTLYAGSLNPLGDRAAFVGTSASWPDFDTVSLDLGAGLAGETLLVRFRIASDMLSGAAGWELDDIGFQGITNTPFPTLVEDATTVCPTAPVADAGPDQQVAGGSAVVLDATGSSDVNGDPLTFHWTETAGPSVTLVDPTSAVATFTAPLLAADTTLTFQVTVNDGHYSDSDTVDVLVLASECLIGGVTYAGGAPNPANECEACDPAVSQSAWSSRAAGTACTDDGLACTTDACDGDGACDHTLSSGCLIAGGCVAAGALDPDNECRECRPEVAADDYADRPAGVACTDDGLPYTGDVCDGEGACVHPDSGTCVIGGQTYVGGVANPGNECVECRPADSQVAWSARVEGFPCGDDALACTADACDGAGTCGHTLTTGCLIEGACVSEGAASPADACMVCSTAYSSTAYTRRGTPECMGGTVKEDSGCSCTVGSAAPAWPLPWLGLLLVAAGGAWRRRWRARR